MPVEDAPGSRDVVFLLGSAALFGCRGYFRPLVTLTFASGTAWVNTAVNFSTCPSNSARVLSSPTSSQSR